MTEQFFDNQQQLAAQAQSNQPALQEGKTLSNSGLIPLFDEDPDDRPHGTQWINQTPEPLPRFKVQIGETTYVVELVPEGMGGSLPVGASIGYHGDMLAGDPPGGIWMLEDGRLLDRLAYPEAYAACGTRYNTGGETSAQFRIPDSRGRVHVGAGNAPGLTNRAQGSRFGEESVVLALTQVPVHSHTASSSSEGHGHTTSGTAHTHYLVGNDWTRSLDRDESGTVFVSNGVAGISWLESDNPDTNSAAASPTIGWDYHSHTITVGNAGSGLGHPNLQPSLAVPQAIRVRP